MKKLLPLLCAATFACSGARASVLLELSGGYLKNASGTKVAAGNGRLVLVASTADAAFTPPTSSTVLAVGKAVTANSDDVILAVTTISGDGNSDGRADAGEFRQAISVPSSATLSVGSPLRIYWFPGLDSAATALPAGTNYGTYRSESAKDEIDADGSDAWFLPPEGTSGHELLFLTSDAGSSIHSEVKGVASGFSDSTVVAGDGVISEDIAVTTSVDRGGETATATTATIPDTGSSLSRRLDALRKQLKSARTIKDAARRKKRLATIRARIEMLLQNNQIDQ